MQQFRPVKAESGHCTAFCTPATSGYDDAEQYFGIRSKETNMLQEAAIIGCRLESIRTFVVAGCKVWAGLHAVADLHQVLNVMHLHCDNSELITCAASKLLHVLF